MIHGAFTAQVTLGPQAAAQGFYTTRWVVAADERAAVPKAFQSARRELDKWDGVRDGLVEVKMEAEDVAPGSWWLWLKSGGRGFSFYMEE